MELKEFVKETLTQIVDGVIEAGEELRKKNADVNPIGGHFDQSALQGRQWSFKEGVTEVVSFDVALTDQSSKGTKGGIGVFLGSVGLGSQGQSEASQTSLSRIRFQIPILLPPGHHLGEQ